MHHVSSSVFLRWVDMTTRVEQFRAFPFAVAPYPAERPEPEQIKRQQLQQKKASRIRDVGPSSPKNATKSLLPHTQNRYNSMLIGRDHHLALSLVAHALLYLSWASSLLYFPSIHMMGRAKSIRIMTFSAQDCCLSCRMLQAEK